MKKLVVYLSMIMLILGLTACSVDNASENIAEDDYLTQSTVQNPSTSKQEAFTTTELDSTQAVDIAMIKQAVMEAMGENYWPNTEITPEFLAGYGLTKDMYEAFWGEMPLISANVDTFIVIQAKEGQEEAVAEVLNAYRNALINDTMQYPVNVGKIQASRVESFDNFVCFIQLGADVTALQEQGEEAIIKHCQEQNELAVKAIGQVFGS